MRELVRELYMELDAWRQAIPAINNFRTQALLERARDALTEPVESQTGLDEAKRQVLAGEYEDPHMPEDRRE